MLWLELNVYLLTFLQFTLHYGFSGLMILNTAFDESPSSKYYSEMYKKTIVFLKHIHKEVSNWKVINTLVLRTLF